MAGNTLFATGVTPTYDTSTPLFGSGALTGAYGNTSTGPGGISGPTGLSSSGWSLEFAAKGSTVPSGTIVLAGYNNAPAYSNAFFIGINSSGYLTVTVWDATGNGAKTYTGASSVATGAWLRIALTVTASAADFFINGALVSTLFPNSGQTFGTCVPPDVSLGNFYGTPTFPATGWEIDEVVIWPTAKYTAAYTPSASPFVGTEGMTALWHLDGSLADSSSAVTIAPNNPDIVYSPYNWLVSAGSAQTINGGAYFKTCFTGSSCTLNFNVGSDSTPVPQLWYSIDGQPFVQIQSLAATELLTMPALTAGWALHSLRVIVKSTSEAVTRWSPQNAAVILTSITLGGGATVSAPGSFPRSVLVLGDSITEGYHTINANTSNDCDGSDSTLAYAYMLGQLLGSEVGVVGFGAQGLTRGGSGGVPALTTSYNQLWSGQARAFSPTPAMIVINIGTNDFPNGVSQATFQASMITLLNALLAACPGVKIAVMQPFEGWATFFTSANRAACTAAIQAAIASVGNVNITYVPTTGMFSAPNPSADGIHPLGVTTITSIAPPLSALLTPILNSPGSQGGGYRGGMLSL